MLKISEGTQQNTKNPGFAILSAFFKLVKNSLDSDSQNPCDKLSLKKLFRAGRTNQFKILDKDLVDEIIF